jgi:hypothetical protein
MFAVCGSPLDLEERLANLVSDRIVPRLVPELESIRGAEATWWLLRSTPVRSRTLQVTLWLEQVGATALDKTEQAIWRYSKTVQVA